jgi:hypothetical protein
MSISQDIERITSPEGAKDAFKLLISAIHGVSSPHAAMRFGTFFSVGLALQRLPRPIGMEDIFDSWRLVANRYLSIWEDTKTKPKFTAAKQDFMQQVRGLLDTYLHER